MEVIWIDDEYKKMKHFIELCKEEGIIITPFDIRHEGMAALEKDLDKWDAVILDVVMSNWEKDLGEFTDARDKITELKLKKSLPFFIFTGQSGVISDGTFKKQYNNVYFKGEDNEKLRNDIITAVNKSPEGYLKNLYHDVYKSLNDLDFDASKVKILSDILMALHFPGEMQKFNPLPYYNQLRQIMEGLFVACHKYKIIPDECFKQNDNSGVNLNQCLVYLSGYKAEHADVYCNNPFVPQYIINLLWSILKLGNQNSHYRVIDESDQDKLTVFFAQTNSKPIIFGLTLQLCDAVVWFDNYIGKHQNIEENKKLCSKYKTIEQNNNAESNTIVAKHKKNNEKAHNGQGEEHFINKDADGIWHAGNYEIKEPKIVIIDYKDNEGKNKDKYPLYATKISIAKKY